MAREFRAAGFGVTSTGRAAADCARPFLADRGARCSRHRTHRSTTCRGLEAVPPLARRARDPEPAHHHDATALGPCRSRPRARVRRGRLRAQSLSPRSSFWPAPGRFLRRARPLQGLRPAPVGGHLGRDGNAARLSRRHAAQDRPRPNSSCWRPSSSGPAGCGAANSFSTWSGAAAPKSTRGRWTSMSAACAKTLRETGNGDPFRTIRGTGYALG